MSAHYVLSKTQLRLHSIEIKAQLYKDIYWDGSELTIFHNALIKSKRKQVPVYFIVVVVLIKRAWLITLQKILLLLSHSLRIDKCHAGESVNPSMTNLHDSAINPQYNVPVCATYPIPTHMCTLSLYNCRGIRGSKSEDLAIRRNSYFALQEINIILFWTPFIILPYNLDPPMWGTGHLCLYPQVRLGFCSVYVIFPYKWEKSWIYNCFSKILQQPNWPSNILIKYIEPDLILEPCDWNFFDVYTCL